METINTNDSNMFRMLEILKQEGFKPKDIHSSEDITFIKRNIQIRLTNLSEDKGEK